MTMHPHIGSENVRERQREMIAQADRRRLERQLSDLARAARRAEAGRRRQRRARALAIRELVARPDLDAWWDGAFGELNAAVAAAAVPPAGPRGALYPAEYFQLDAGEITAYIPVVREVRPGGRAAILDIPAAELAVAVHKGAVADLDRTYGALGTYVARREIGAGGPIREHYLVTAFDTDGESRHLTEVGWPVRPAPPPS
jgi:effector-binding domain-containing protein